MKRNIEIDITHKYDFIDKYNEKKASNEIIEYIIKQAMNLSKYEKIKVIINKKCDIEQDCIKMIKEGLKEAYDSSIEQRHENNIKQLYLLVLGISFLFLSTLIKQPIIWKEILLIIGWVPIWEMIELELFPDVEGRMKRNIVKKLLNSEIIEKCKETTEIKI